VKKIALTASMVLSVAPFFGMEAHAADIGAGAEGLQEVIITAERREESVQKTSIAITTISGEDISREGDSNAQNILRNVPGVVVQGTARGQMVAIRGLGSDLPPQVGESAVSMNFDGIYNFRSEAGTYGYFDLARVEVLRGPQGTLYGRNATGGVVNVVTNDPEQEFGAHGVLEFGNYSLVRAEGAINVPVSDDWAVRAAAVSMNRDGYSNNGSNDAVGSGARVKLRYQPNADFRLQLNVERSKIGGKGPSFSDAAQYAAGNPFYISAPASVSNHYQATRYWAQLDMAMGPGHLTVLPSYQRASGYNYSPPMGPPGQCPTGLDCLVRNDDPTLAEAKSAELRYASLSDSAIKWVAGAYYYDQDDSSQAFQGDVHTDTTNKAVFGQLIFPLSSTLRGIVGARESWDTKRFFGMNGNFGSGIGGSDDRNAFDWKAGVEVDLAAASMLYFTVASGHRPGGYNALAAGAAPLVEIGSFYDPESLVSFELGSKNQFFDDRLRLNGALFYYDYKDFQAPHFYDCPVGEVCPPGLLAEFINVPKVEDYGAEFEMQALVGRGTTVSLSATWLKAEFGTTVVNPSGGPNVVDKGDPLTHSPKFTTKGGIEHVFELGEAGSLRARLDARYTGDQWVNIGKGDPDNLQKSYVTADFSLSFRAPEEKWSVSAYVKNLNDKVVKTAAFGPPFPDAGDYGLSDPRTYGVSLSARL
jgi:iron complex outermembrane receptor protein